MKKQLTLNKFTIAKLNKLEEARIIGGKNSKLVICDNGVTGNSNGCVSQEESGNIIC